jgi:hypothetical protein
VLTLMQESCKLKSLGTSTLISMSWVYHAEIACRKLDIPMPTGGKTDTNLEHRK